MKIKYEFATETVEIEVTDDWGTILIDLDRQEYNNDHAETRRHCSLEAYGENHTEMISDMDAMGSLFGPDLPDDVAEAMDQLKPEQKDLIQALFFEGLSNEEYAHRCGVTPGAISQRKATTLKKIKKFFEKPKF